MSLPAFLPQESLFLVGTLLAGFFSLAHCSVMCGPLVLLFREHWIAYHLGRITGYTLVGTLLGAIGLSLDRAGLLLSIQNFSIYVAGFFMLAYGIGLILPGKVRWKTPAWLFLPASWISRLRNRAGIPASLSIYLAGTLSALIPCGVLYPVWALAAGAGSPIYGSEIALAFVLGTLPGLVLIQLLAKRAGDRIAFLRGRKLRYIATTFLVVSGLFLIVYRSNFAPKMDFSETARNTPANCHPGNPQGENPSEERPVRQDGSSPLSPVIQK